MHQYLHFFPKLALAVSLLLVALAAAPLFRRVRLPSPAAFLTVGIIAGLAGLAPLGGPSRSVLEEVGALALFGILFEGGLATGFRAARGVVRPVVSLGLIGTVGTAAGLAGAGRFVLGMDWSLALLIGVALAPTDPAAVYAVLRGRQGSDRARTVLEGESGFNDPAGIALMIAVAATVAGTHASYEASVLRFSEQLSIGSAAGVLGGLALIGTLRRVPRRDDGIDAVAMLLAVAMIGAVTATIHGSGFLAVYIVGLLLSDSWAGRPRATRVVSEAASAIAEPLLFVMLGAAFAPLVGLTDIARGLVLTLITVFVLRPAVASVCLIGSGLRSHDRALVSWGGLKGAVPLLLAGYPALDRVDRASTVAATVLVATTASLIIQGATLPLIANRAAVCEQRERTPAA